MDFHTQFHHNHHGCPWQLHPNVLRQLRAGVLSSGPNAFRSAVSSEQSVHASDEPRRKETV